MNKRILGSAALLALVLAGIWAVAGREAAGGRLEPAPRLLVTSTSDAADQVSPEPPDLGEKAVLPDPSRVVIAPETADTPTKATFALVKVLVVSKENRAPLAGISVNSTYDDGKPSHRIEPTRLARGGPFEDLVTDPDGRVEIETPPDVETTVRASGRDQAAGYDSAKIQPLGLGSTHEIVLTIPTTNDMPFWMKVVDDEAHAPLPHVAVNVLATKGKPEMLHTDTRGLVLFSGRSWARELLRIDADGRASLYVAPEPGHERAESALEVAIPKGASLRVHVVDAAGKPVERARVELATPGYNVGAKSAGMGFIDMPDPIWKSETDASGTTVLTELPPRVPLQPAIRSPRKWTSAEPLVLVPGDEREVTWVLGAGCDVHGIVMDQHGVPVVRREMWMRLAEREGSTTFQSYTGGETLSRSTDDEGRFRFPGVSAGAWWVGPGVPKYGTTVGPEDVVPFAQWVEVHEGQSDLDVTVLVDRGLFIRGRLLGSDGEPCKSGSVSAYDSATKSYVNGRVEKGEEEFAIGPLAKGRYTLRGSAHFSGDADSEPIEAETGSENVVLRLRAGTSLSGRVLDQENRPVLAKIWTRMRNPDGSSGAHGINSKNDGTFLLQRILPGTYDLAAFTTDGSVGIIEGVDAGPGTGATDLVIRLQAGGHVRVRHEGPELYANVEVLHDGIVVDLDGVRRETSRTLTAPAGPVRVQLRFYGDDPRTLDRIVDVKPGETVDVTFEKGAR